MTFSDRPQQQSRERYRSGCMSCQRASPEADEKGKGGSVLPTTEQGAWVGKQAHTYLQSLGGRWEPIVVQVQPCVISVEIVLAQRPCGLLTQAERAMFLACPDTRKQSQEEDVRP
ncbi:hypothetical protein DPEC_G00204180 [Dallia pectoralis]|uniref:Uncharacterized protein n=1 Tax=Dallia pectoralis TaxID=75939 RepID=A0ACC2G9R8_DALPE|nr:hypothetical protein DPEC_G00204180 [Dallia pectoralis]